MKTLREHSGHDRFYQVRSDQAMPHEFQQLSIKNFTVIYALCLSDDLHVPLVRRFNTTQVSTLIVNMSVLLFCIRCYCLPQILHKFSTKQADYSCVDCLNDFTVPTQRTCILIIISLRILKRDLAAIYIKISAQYLTRALDS